MYPAIDIPRIKNPRRFYAIPFVGGIVKFFMLIPVFFWLMLIGIAFAAMSLVNSFVVLFTGKYWRPAYDVTSLLIRLSVKTSYFFLGLTNRYPGFTGETKDFTIDIAYPQKSNRFFAIPLLGGLARWILLIPYLIYVSVIQYAGNLAAVVASFPVLFMGTYPDSLYELGRDSVRLNTAIIMYGAGLSDSYPSWWISMKHKGIKILFIVLAVILFLLNTFNKPQNNNSYQYQQYNYPSPASTY